MLRFGQIHDGRPGTHAHVHHHGDLARTRVHVAMDEAGRDVEEVSRRELDRLLSVSAMVEPEPPGHEEPIQVPRDRKSTRLNYSHMSNSYAVFCLKKKKKKKRPNILKKNMNSRQDHHRTTQYK